MFGNDSVNYGAPVRNNNSGKKVKVLTFAAVSTGKFENQHYRPYEINLNGDTAKVLENRIGNSLDRFSTINAATFSGIASNILRPSAVPTGVAQIENGWDTKRFQFYMIVEIDAGFITQREIILGYSDYAGLSNGGFIDPAMRFVVNSVSRVQVTNANVPAFPGANGGVAAVGNRFIEASHVMANNNHISSLNQDSLFTMRATDVYGSIHANALNEFTPTINTGCILTSDAQKAARAESNPNAYLTSVLGAYYTADKAASVYGQQDSSLLSTAASNTAPLHMMEDPFLSAIIINEGFGTVNSFSWGDLMRLDPNVENPSVSSFMDSSKVMPTNAVGNSGSASVNAQISAVISGSVTSIMMQSGVSELKFSATNQTLDGSCVLNFDPTVCRGFIPGGNLGPILDIIRTRIAAEVLHDISRQNIIPYQVSVHMRLYGRSVIELAFNDPQFETFVIPTFGDAMFSPIVANNQHHINALASGFNSIFQDILPPSPIPTGYTGNMSFQADLESSKPYSPNEPYNQPQQQIHIGTGAAGGGIHSL